MIAYDTRYDPPAPCLRIAVSRLARPRRRRVVHALLDTGSDITALPHRLADSLRLYPIGRLRLEDVKANTAPVLTYAVRLTLADVTIPRLEVILTGLDIAVLGRDVLNRFYALLNGPDLAFDLSESPLLAPH